MGNQISNMTAWVGVRNPHLSPEQVEVRRTKWASNLMSRKKEVDFLLLGKTGNGKSATGNSILKKEAFAVSNSLKSTTVGAGIEFSEYKNYSIAVTDTQGYAETSADHDFSQKTETLSQIITMAMKANHGKGFHAFLVILKNGNRLTDEEKDAITASQRLFPGFMSTHGILLMTGGDMFERDRKKTGIAFEDWTRQQGEDLDKLLTEFGGRIVLFDNETENEAQRDAQIDRLLEMVESLPSRGKRYSHEFFTVAWKEFIKSVAESRHYIWDRETLRSVSIVLDKFDECGRHEDQKNGADPEGQMEKWYNLLSRCNQLIDRIRNRGEREMTDVEKRVVALRANLKVFINGKESKTKPEVSYHEMLAVKNKLQQTYADTKFMTNSLIIGGTLLCAGVVARAIYLIMKNLPSMALIHKVARLISQNFDDQPYMGLVGGLSRTYGIYTV